MPSEYTKHFDPTGNAIPVPDAVLIVNVKLLVDLVVDYRAAPVQL